MKFGREETLQTLWETHDPSDGQVPIVGTSVQKECRTKILALGLIGATAKKRKQVSKRSNIPHTIVGSGIVGLPGTLRMPHMHGPILCSWALPQEIHRNQLIKRKPGA